jgi:hypothetical protein
VIVEYPVVAIIVNVPLARYVVGVPDNTPEGLMVSPVGRSVDE